MLDMDPGVVVDGNMPLWYHAMGNAKFTIYVTQTILADSFMVRTYIVLLVRVLTQGSTQVYRLDVVWDRHWQALVFPGVLLLSDAGQPHTQPKRVAPVDDAWGPVVALGYAVPLTRSVPPMYFFVTSFLTNTFCTGAYIRIPWPLAFLTLCNARVAFIMRKVLLFSFKVGKNSLLRKVMEGIIQSAAVYSAASIVLVITVFESPYVGYLACLNVFPALIVSSVIISRGVLAPDHGTQGLVFSSIVIRLGLQARKV